MSQTSPSAPRSDLLGAVSAQVARHEADTLSAAGLRAWLAEATAGRPGMLMALASAVEARRERGECSSRGWTLLLAQVQELMEDQTSTEPGGPGDPPAPPIRPGTDRAPPYSGSPLSKTATDRVLAAADRARGTPAAPPKARGAERSPPPLSGSPLRTAAAGRAPGEPAAPRQPPPPARIADRFQLLEMVREGACSRVYRALDTQAASDSPDRFVALRLVPRTQLPRLSEEDRNALRALSRHRNLATIIAWGDSEGWSYQAMPWLDGVTLDQLLAGRSNVPGVLADAPDWIVEIAAALDALHSQDFVHGDVAPANIMVTHEGHAVLIDLNGVRRGAFRMAGGAGLTRAFASPEALAGSPADPRDDVYGLGAIAFRLLAGHLPHGREGSAVEGHPLPPPSRPSGLPDAQWQALSSALDPARERRPSSAGAFAMALRGRGRAARAQTQRAGPMMRGGLAVSAIAVVLVAGGWALLPSYAQLLPVDPPEWLLPPWGAVIAARDEARSVDDELAGPPARVDTDAAMDPAPSGEPLPSAEPEVSDSPQVADAPRTEDVALPEATPETVDEGALPALSEAADAPATAPRDAADALPDMPGTISDEDTAIVAGEVVDRAAELEPVEVTVSARNITIPPAPTRYTFPEDELRITPGAAAAMLPVTRSGPLDESVEVPFILLPGSAMPDEDFAWPGRLVARFTAGEARALIVVPLIHGTESRAERWFLVRLEPDDPDTLGRTGEVVVTLPAVR